MFTKNTHFGKSFSRRAFLRLTGQVAVSAVICRPFESSAIKPQASALSFYHTHTHETLAVDFGAKSDKSLLKRKINYFLRDFRTGEVHPIDLRLLNLLYNIQEKSGSRGAFEVISGYRSPATNRTLRSKSNGVAKKSLHMSGQAIDVRLTGLKTDSLRDIAWSMQKGGVGYYAQSDFVHLDTGRVRCW